jgi:hypothetical protein
MKPSLKSSVESKGKTVTEIITMVNGYKKTFRGVKTETLEQGEFTHFETKDGRLVLVNTPNVLFVEIFNETTS